MGKKGRGALEDTCKACRRVYPSLDPLLLFDAHCHYHDHPYAPPSRRQARESDALCTCGNAARIRHHVCLVGVNPRDWSRVARWIDTSNGMQRAGEEFLLKKGQLEARRNIPARSTTCDEEADACSSTAAQGEDEEGEASESTEISRSGTDAQGRSEAMPGWRVCVGAFGVHPWSAHRHVDQWDAVRVDLERVLEARPYCIVGEIGLDRAAKTPDTGVCEWEAQVQMFKEQLAFAAEYNRPVSLHVVRAWGELHTILKEAKNLPPRIQMHSYGGSADFARSLRRMKKLKGRLFFSFSVCINMRSPKTRQEVPDDEILLESDIDTAESSLQLMEEMCSIVAEMKGWSVEEAATKTLENARRFFGLPSVPA